MGVLDESRDPWALLLGGIAGGLSWAVGAPVLAAAGVGAAVVGVKAVTGALLNRSPSREHVSVRHGSPEWRWLNRAERALTSFRRLASSAPDGPITEKVTRMGTEASRTLDAVRNLAGQASALAGASDRVDALSLAEEAARVRERLEGASAAHRYELERSLASVQSQLEVAQRLEEAARTLMARLEAAVLGIESLVTRLVEVLALAKTQSPVETAGEIDALESELEGLRSGLAETEEVSRRVLSAYVPDEQTGGRRSRRWRTQERGDEDVQAP